MKTGGSILLVVLLSPLGSAHAADAVLENDHLQVTFSGTDGSLQVKVKSSGDVWTQEVASPYRVTTMTAGATTLTAEVVRNNEALPVVIALTPGADELTVQFGSAGYVAVPDYPYPFTMPADQGYYVQNTTGDGALFSLSEASTIQHMYDFIGIPWWGLTDFKKGMMAILDTPYRPGEPARAACLGPIHMRYVFFPSAGYVEMARYYRSYFLAQYPDLQANPLTARASKPGFANLKDGVYVYFWDDARDGAFMTSVHDAGIEHAVATIYYGNHQQTDAELATMFQAAKAVGWTAGMYTDPGGNLSNVAGGEWPNEVAEGADPVAFFNAHPNNWDTICTKLKAPAQIPQFQALASTIGLDLMYFDTYVVQYAPCLDASHPGHLPLQSGGDLPSSLEEQRQLRIQFLDALRGSTSAVGSGEGNAPAWSFPHLDFFEGSMMLRTYGESSQKIPSGGYNSDFEPATDPPPPGLNADFAHRIPLFELQFHDYVASTWNWRNTNFQYLGTSAQKDLLNALYGTMPMWNMTTGLWAAHQPEFLASYAFQKRARARIGFDDMVGHGWLSDDRKLQYTDWASGVRIVANFDTAPRTVDGQTIAGMDFVVIDGAPVDAGVGAGPPDMASAGAPPETTGGGCSVGGRRVGGAPWIALCGLLAAALLCRRRGERHSNQGGGR